jgi:hypothetical protein
MLPRAPTSCIAFLAAYTVAACDREDDDGVGKACKSDADCPTELECELEHGDGYCKPHDDDAADTNDETCTVDADCPAGLECELEHDQGYCKPHGGDDANAATPPASA